MTFILHAVAPENCRSPRCGYLIENAVTIGGRTERDDRCDHGVPMHDACPWHRTPEQIADMHAREARLMAEGRR